MLNLNLHSAVKRLEATEFKTRPVRFLGTFNKVREKLSQKIILLFFGYEIKAVPSSGQWR